MIGLHRTMLAPQSQLVPIAGEKRSLVAPVLAGCSSAQLPNQHHPLDCRIVVDASVFTRGNDVTLKLLEV